MPESRKDREPIFSFDRLKKIVGGAATLAMVGFVTYGLIRNPPNSPPEQTPTEQTQSITVEFYCPESNQISMNALERLICIDKPAALAIRHP